MLEVLLYGIYAHEFVQTLYFVDQPILELLRVPWTINLGILGAVIVPMVAQGRVRPALTALSLCGILVCTGLIFTTLLLLAVTVVFLSARWLSRWSAERKDPSRPLLVGWGVVHLMYLPVFYVILPPFNGHMTFGEVTQFWGAAFVVMKSIHYIRVTCDGQVDPFAAGAFRRFLLYMIHIASFRFGPYQTFRQFDGEVDTCKDRITPENRKEGMKRILMGLGKFMLIYSEFNCLFFFPNGYMGPLAEEMFLNASTADPMHLWIMAYIYVIRMCLFISGLSDGVIGMNLMMGIRVPENSNWPIFSRDVIEFWQRWHMQTGAFLRDEVFFTVGGLRNRNWGFFCVFAYCGLWHFPAILAIIGFAVLQLIAFEATNRWNDFWQAHEKADDWVAALGKRFYLYNSPLSHVLGIIIVVNVMALSCLFVFDHNYGGLTMLARMFGVESFS